jgi:hypothetical protein
MDVRNIDEQVLYISELVKQNKFDEAAVALSSINVDELLCSSEFITLLISIEQTACRLFKDCLKYTSEVDRPCLKYIEEMGLFNRRIATLSTETTEQIRIQSQLLFDKEVLQTLVSIVDALLINDDLHHRDFILFLCTWLEAIAHFVHRHDNLSTEVLQPLRQSMLSCVLSDWYRTYLKQSPEMNILARLFFVRTCSFVTGVFQCSQLSFENALKTAQSYQIVIGIGEKIFDHNLVDFRHHLQELKNIEDDSACLTGVCLLITNCYKHEVFRNDDAYFTLLLRLLRSDFVRKDLLPTWTNDSTILADTLMVQLKNSSNDSTIRLFLQQNQAAKDIYPYIYAEYDRLRLQACMLLGVLLDDIMIRQLQIPSDKLTDLYFTAIQHAHKSPNKCYRRVPVHLLLKALSALVHNDTIQVSIATSINYFDYLISVTDDYNIIYDILWTLSFNKKLHEKFNSHDPFLTQLRTFADQPKKAPEKDVARAAEGILWNLLDRNQVIALPGPADNVNQQNTNSEK